MANLGIFINTLLVFGMIGIDIIYLVLWIVKQFKCREIEECKNRHCPIRDKCNKYTNKLTPEEYERVSKLISELDD